MPRIFPFALLSFSIFLQIGLCEEIVPVVYICYGKLPPFLLMNLELAMRQNSKVILISNIEPKFDPLPASWASKLKFVQMNEYDSDAVAFSKIYHHISIFNREPAVLYELRCFQRWFILRDYMKKNSIQMVYYADGDSALYANITKVVSLRKPCSATINIEAQEHNFHWVGAGESSIWTIDAIIDFCA